MVKLNRKKIKSITFMAFLIVVLLMGLFLLPFFKNPENYSKIIFASENYTFRGMLILFLIQVIQVIVAVIPGGFAEFSAGAVYGTFPGFLISFLGIALGEYLIYKIVSLWGNDVIKNVLNKNFIKKYNFLKDSKKIRRIIFILFLIPGSPKDLLTYFAPLLNISLKDFLIISMIARAPAILVTTFASRNLISGSFAASAIVFSVLALASVAGAFLYKKFFNKEK